MTPSDTPRIPFGTILWEWAKSLSVALVIWIVTRTFIFATFHIPSGSMEHTLRVGDLLVVNKMLYGAEVPFVHKRLPALRTPRRGDILVFDSVEEAGLEVVKRLVGVPGDTLSMRAGELYRNGTRLDEPWVLHVRPNGPTDPADAARMRAWQLPHLALADGPARAAYAPDYNNWGPLVIPADSFFMMGDSRDNSYDSRVWGPLPRASVRGRPEFVYFSYDADSWRALPAITAVRWSRLFTLIR